MTMCEGKVSMLFVCV